MNANLFSEANRGINRRGFLAVSGMGAAALVGGCATAPAKPEVRLMRSESKLVQDAKRAALARLKELGPTITDFEIRRKKNIPGKRAAFYIDDVIWLFRELAATAPKSCWDHRFLGHLKEAHEKYGLKVQLNVFFRDDFYYGARTAEFSLREMPELTS